MTDRAKLSLSGGENPNPTWMNPVLDDGIAESDDVVAVWDFMAVGGAN